MPEIGTQKPRVLLVSEEEKHPVNTEIIRYIF